MGSYENISSEKVVALHKFIRLLRRLGVVGKVFTTTVSADRNIPVSAMGFADRDSRNNLKYTIRYDGYDPSRYEMIVELKLERIFGNRMSTDPWTTHFKF